VLNQSLLALSTDARRLLPGPLGTF
jgi:hypothetical protein